MVTETSAIPKSLLHQAIAFRSDHSQKDLPMSAISVIPGAAEGRLLYSDTPLSFMGGVDPRTGVIIDTHHPLCGECIAGRVLAIPSGRGSCAGSLALFELMMNGHAPKALIFQHQETILALGVLVAQELFGKSLPVVRLSSSAFASLAQASHVSIHVEGRMEIDDRRFRLDPLPSASPGPDDLELEARDLEMLEGQHGPAMQAAMKIIVATARLEGAPRLVDVSMAHIDGCFYHGPGVLAFVSRLRDLGATVKVPSTMNALCVDRMQWRALGIDRDLGEASDAIARHYEAMGVSATYTCAPYLLDPKPAAGQQIAWGESNAVVFANSVLAARTMKYPDYLDILVAITGRAPLASCHDENRRKAEVIITVEAPIEIDDAFWPTLGYRTGTIATNAIPVLDGLQGTTPSHDDLKAFGAAFATTSAAPMFHIAGITPEALTVDAVVESTSPILRLIMTRSDLKLAWDELNSARSPGVELVALGNPHFSVTECRDLAALCRERKKHSSVDMIVTCGREVYDQALKAGYVDTIRAFGARFLNDTCWCLIGEPVVRQDVHNIMTNSGKYAHYGPAAVGKGFHFGSLRECVEAAETGSNRSITPPWLQAKQATPPLRN